MSTLKTGVFTTRKSITPSHSFSPGLSLLRLYFLVPRVSFVPISPVCFVVRFFFNRCRRAVASMHHTMSAVGRDAPIRENIRNSMVEQDVLCDYYCRYLLKKWLQLQSKIQVIWDLLFVELWLQERRSRFLPAIVITKGSTNERLLLRPTFVKFHPFSFWC